mmetsp:Transcript_82899/g.208931  ORF Transcript_82899/g.208931 Transcript_82899/m.208931 type:complete len:322 (+) Transcript_82899:57-1022(+)
MAVEMDARLAICIGLNNAFVGNITSESCRLASARLARWRSFAVPSLATRRSGASVDFLAGLIAGIAVDVPLHPLDTFKTRLQAPEGFAASGGMRGLWSGLSPVVLRALPCSALFFSTYGALRTRVGQCLPMVDGSPCCDAAAGAAANTVACSVRVPLEVIKQKMQARGLQRPASSLLAVARSVSAGGFRRCYAGFGATVSRELVFAAVQMPLFEHLKRARSQLGDSDVSEQILTSTLCGGVSGAVAGALTTPLDVAKTRMMLGTQQLQGRGVHQTIAALFAEGGVPALMRGAVPRTAYVGLNSALSFGAFEWSKALISRFV